MEKTNARYLKGEHLPEVIDGAVVDVSFISLKLVIPTVSRVLQEKAFIISLIKPQFEVQKGRVGKGGVVRDSALHDEIVDKLSRFFENERWTDAGRIPSPLLGPKGNREFLIHVTR
jgi:23S rRNA (cytidine1920-2'-O)/16S rRNA (cytidine1409-2'-O)-methyltransferase